MKREKEEIWSLAEDYFANSKSVRDILKTLEQADSKEKIKELFKFAIEMSYFDGRLAGEYSITEPMGSNIGKYLTYLDASGWSELIDERWKGDVVSQLKNAFPEITQDEIDELCSVVII